MFSLIIAIVGIALLVALIATTLYFGGNTEQGRDTAVATQFLAQGQQITAADVFFRSANKGQSASSLEALVPTYLRSIPEGWTSVDDFVVSVENTNISDAACEAYNAKVGVIGIPSCSDPAFADVQVCCNVAD